VLSLIDERGRDLTIDPDVFIIAGYTGRDRAMVQKHIDELAHEGIAPPPEVPMLYPMPVEILTTAERIDVTSPQSCGEVEPVLIGVGDALYLGVGSDHTARDVEREDIGKSKCVCPKPLGRSVVRIAELGPALDALVLESSIDDEPYQRGTLAQMLSLASLVELFRSRIHAANFVLYCGTVPLLGGAFRFGKRFEGRLHGEFLPHSLTVAYEIAGVATPVQGE
jgi:hypothetical protein